MGKLGYISLPLVYFCFNYVTVFDCISVTIIVSVNGMNFRRRTLSLPLSLTVITLVVPL
jgi:hypothetical protein